MSLTSVDSYLGLLYLICIERIGIHKRLSSFSKENFPKVMALVDDLKTISKRHNATPGQICLAWLLAAGLDIIPIPGTKSVKVRYNIC
jgi:aryl-alcohol dehydrogenase-like predicted oxidoreductase